MNLRNAVQDIRARVEALLPEISERAREIESRRRVPADLVQRLRRAGCFRMVVPSGFGGANASQIDLFELYEALACADASVAWIVMIGSPTPSYLQRFCDDTIRKAYAGGPDVILGVALAPTGNATPVRGGYTVSGRWSWCSGSLDASLFMCNCIVDGEDGDPATGFPAMRFALLSPDEVEIIDNWYVSGLKGTGSGDIVVAEAFVPEARTATMFDPPSPLLRDTHGVGLAAAPYVASVALGIARGALADLHGLARADKRRLGASTRMADDELFQYRLGEAETALRAARVAFYAQVEAWEQLAHHTPTEASLYAHPLLHATNATSVWALKQCVSVVDIAYSAGGGSSVWEHSPLQRRFRDIHAATQHISVQDAVLTRHGGTLVAHR